MKNDALLKALRDASPGMDARLARDRRRGELARALVLLRKSEGLTQAGLAARLGWSQPQVSQMESATGPLPRGDRVAAYVRACRGTYRATIETAAGDTLYDVAV